MALNLAATAVLAVGQWRSHATWAKVFNTVRTVKVTRRFM